MPDIRYVCLSDTHFGAETSLLTYPQPASDSTTPSPPSPVLKKLVECLRYFIAENASPEPKPTLILNGDILEMALTNENEAAMTFERFIDLVMADEEKLFGRIIYIPGNHDHHLWETARETQYAEFLKNKEWGEPLEIGWHATKIFSDPVPSYFLNRLLQRRPNPKELTVETVYPNFGLLRPDRSRAVIFHHGHFVEPIYLLMSRLKTMFFPNRLMPQEVWDFEAENFAWIDFFWSLLGRSGEVGKGVGIIYEKFQDEQQTNKLLKNLAKGLADGYNLPVLGEGAEARFFEKVFRAIVEQVRFLERQQNTGGDLPLSQDALKGLEFYLRGPLTRQIQKECREPLPYNMTFVFGHTHQPFERNMYFKDYPGWTDVYNSGGWVVDAPKPQSGHGGAVILVDEDLNTASVRFYYESGNPEDYQVTASDAKETKPKGPLFERLSVLIRDNPNLFRSFADAVAREVEVRIQNIRERIDRES